MASREAMSLHHLCWDSTMPLDRDKPLMLMKEEILAINRPIDMKILVSISCTMCPELVTSAQRIAAIKSAGKGRGL